MATLGRMVAAARTAAAVAAATDRMGWEVVAEQPAAATMVAAEMVVGMGLAVVAGALAVEAAAPVGMGLGVQAAAPAARAPAVEAQGT